MATSKSTSKAQLATDKALSNIANATTKEAKDKAIKDGAKAIVETVKEIKPTMFTRIQAVGIIMKANPDATKEVICNKADSLFIKKTASASNIKETETQYSKAVNFLKGYNSK